MTISAPYTPGPAGGIHVEKDGEKWTLVVVRELRHAPDTVWQALTDPAQLREWAPFDADRNLGAAGTTAKLTTFGAPGPHVTDTTITRAERPGTGKEGPGAGVLEYTWGGFAMRWRLEPIARGTRLTLWTNIDRRFIAMGAAGWHVCLDVMDRLLDGTPVGRIAGPDAMTFDGWQRLNAEYSRQFASETKESSQ